METCAQPNIQLPMMTCILSNKYPEEDEILGESTDISTDYQQESSRVQPTTDAKIQIEGVVT